MNKQKLNKILIVALILIWSFIGYNFVSNYNSQNKVINIDRTNAKIIAKQDVSKRNSIQITKLNRDPFLGTYIIEKKVIKTKKSKRPKRIIKKTPWPKIEYFGYVQSSSNKDPLVLLKVNNKIKRVRKGDRSGEFFVKNVYKDSIEIRKGKEKRVFVKQ